MKRRGFLSLASGMAAASVLPSVATADTGTEAIFSRARALVSDRTAPLVGLIPDGSQDNLAPVAAAWTEATGQNVVFDVVSLDDINGRMTADVLTGKADYDFALPATFGLADLVWAEVVQPFEPLQAATQMPPLGPGFLYQRGDIVDGKRYGFQTDGDVYLMFYRKDMMRDSAASDAYVAKYGKQPVLPTTWQELDRQMESFHAPEAGRFGGALYRTPGYLAWEYMSRLYGKGILPFDGDFDPQFTDDRAVEALEEMKRATDFLHPGAWTAGLFGNFALYPSADIYANIGWGGGQKRFNAPDSPIRDKLAFGPLPSGQGGANAYFNWGWSYVVLNHARLPQLAYLFARLAMTEEISTRSVREVGGYFDPFHVAHYDDPIIEKAYSRAFLDVHRAAMEGAGPDLYLPGHGNYMASINEHLAIAMRGERSSRSALELISSEWRLISFEFGVAEQRKRWEDLQKEAI